MNVIPGTDDTRAALECLARDGYVILTGVLSADDRRAVIDALAPYEHARPMGRNGFEGERSTRVYSLAGKGEAFLRLAEHPRIVPLLDQLLLPQYLLSTLQSIRLHPGERAQSWHVDDLFYPLERPHARLSVSTIWALEDFTDENGATELIPGSHRWGMEHPEGRPHEVVRAVMPAGSVVIFEGALWHRGGANTSSGTRLAVSPQYCQPWLRPQESQLLVAPPEVAKSLSPGMQAMLGYSIHPPFIGQVDGMHPMRLLDPAYRRHKTAAAGIADRLLAHPVPTDSETLARIGR